MKTKKMYDKQELLKKLKLRVEKLELELSDGQ